MQLKSRHRSILFLVLLAALALPMSAQTEPTQTATTLQQAYGRLPLAFEVNQGQSTSQVKFLSRGRGYTLFLTSTEAVLAIRKDEGRRMKDEKGPHTGSSFILHPSSFCLHMRLVGANPAPQVVGLDVLSAKSNYFIGNDPQKWRTAVPNYARVEYRDVYPGVNLVYHGNQGQLEYDFVVAPGVSPRTIKLAFKGAQKLRIDAQGDLILQTPGGEIRQHKPLVYQEVNGVKRAIPGRYVRMGKQQVGFQVAAYDTSRPLVIDPVLVYSTYLGGRGDDQGVGIAVDAAGNAYLTGKTNSPNFPTASAAQTAPGE
jgi:hypothetical protein